MRFTIFKLEFNFNIRIQKFWMGIIPKSIDSMILNLNILGKVVRRIDMWNKNLC